MPEPEKPLEPKAPEDPTLQILQTLHAASLNRWTNRRDYEWKINYAIWAAMIGLIAILVTNHIGFTTPDTMTVLSLIVTAIGVIVIQILYLIPVTSRGIKEIEMQTDLEEAMRSQLKREVQHLIKVGDLGAGMRHRTPLDKHYGMFAPVAVTSMLLLVASILLVHPLKQFENQPPSAHTQPCTTQK